MIATELLGNGVSSPHHTSLLFIGPRFRVTKIRDMVELIRRLLVEEFGVEHLDAVVGFSMGDVGVPARRQRTRPRRPRRRARG